MIVLAALKLEIKIEPCAQGQRPERTWKFAEIAIGCDEGGLQVR